MPMLHSFKASRAPVKRVKGIQFCIWDPEDIKKYSVVHVTEPVTVVNGEPRKDGLADLRMGSSERHAVCTTDGMDREEGCPGYFGHVELATPLYHIGFNKTVLKVLRCVGYHSSKLLLDPSNPKDAAMLSILSKTVLGPARLERAMKACSNKQTDYNSGTKQPKYKLEPKMRINVIAEFRAPKKNEEEDEEEGAVKMERTQELTAEQVYNILKGISDEDCRLLGFDPRYCRPDWMMLTVLPVPPPHTRPAVEMDSTGRCEDDLTHHLASIIRDNQALKAHMASGSPAHVLKEYVELLQHAVITLMDNGKPGIPRANVNRSSRPVKSFSQRLKGKHGRIRGNLMGKRVDFSARSVITGDALIDIDELGVPWSIARNLTVPERVTPHNIDWLQTLVDRGPHPPPGLTGAKEIFREDGYPISISHSNRNKVDMRLEPGYIVERHLQNGDFVVFNRAPSLHKMSMMAHRVRILPYSTFRLNLSVTPPYNADFDGDEMNMHVPQSYEARAELWQLMHVSRNIVSPQSNRPVMKIVQDSLLASRLMTRRDTFISRSDFMGLCMQLRDWDGVLPQPAILKPEPLWTGKQAFSLLFDRTLSYRGSASGKLDTEDSTHPGMSPTDCQVLIRKGQLLAGMLDKKALGDSGGGLIHIIFNEEGFQAAANFISVVQFVVNNWMAHHSFSCGIGDTVADPETMSKIAVIIQDAKGSVQEIIKAYQGGKLEERPGRTMHETFEDKVNAAMNAAREKAGKTALESLRFSNNVVQMSLAGSKGSNLNISQMVACCAQQNVEGKRIPFGFTARTLPHFNKDNYGPESRGFVENSYLQGLSPQEFFFHAMGGREGLIDTAVKTANSGYIQRRLVKALEDLIIHYDNTVRSCTGSVVQFLYGEDGMDGAAIERQRLTHLRDSPAQFAARFAYDVGAQAPDWVPKGLADRLLTDTASKQAHLEEIEMLKEGLRVLRQEVIPSGDNEVQLPVNLQRLVVKAQTLFGATGGDASFGPLEIVNGINGLVDRLTVVPGKDRLSEEAQRNATILLFNHIRSTLSSKQVLRDYKLSAQSFNWLLSEIESRFHSALAQPGEMVGTVAAQSLGEPTTQMTLNTFHNAGVAAKNVTLGVPRLTEIINIAKNIKTPSLTIYLTPAAAVDQDLAKATQTKIEYTTVESVTRAVEIWYDPDPRETVIEEDQELLEAYLLVPEGDFQPELQSPWLLRIELDKMMMLDKRLECVEVASKIGGSYLGLVHVISSEDNADKLVLRIRLIEDDKNTDDEEEQNLFMVKFEHHLLENVALQGIRNVRKVFMRQEESTIPNPTDALLGYERRKEWLLDSEGINLAEVLQADNVDATRTLSNHVVEMFEVLGIEAARLSVLKELRAVLEFDGSKVNYRHMASLVDIMTARGQIMAITRHGINRRDSSPIAQSSFEETVEILFRAATYGEFDHLRGVSENILLGQVCPLGTGSFALVLDNEKLLDAIETMGADVLGLNMGTGAYNPLSGAGASPAAMTPMHFKASPSDFLSPQMSPLGGSDVMFSPTVDGGMSPTSPSYSPTSPGLYSPSSPAYSPSSPAYTGARTSPGYSPTSPGYSAQSPGYSPTSPAYSPTSPQYSPTSPTSPGYSPTSPAYSPTSPGYSPTSPAYSPSSPALNGGTSPGYSPTSPAYSPTSPAYSPTSPAYSPTSPAYSPTSPAYSPTSPAYSPTSPAYSPTSPTTSPTSPSYSPTSPAYSPTSPTSYSPLSPAGAYSPTSPSYSPTSPSYSPTSPAAPGTAQYSPQQAYSPTSPSYSPTSPNYSPQSPSYSPSAPGSSSAQPGYSPMSPSYSPQTAQYSPTQPHPGQSNTYSPHGYAAYSPAGAPPSGSAGQAPSASYQYTPAMPSTQYSPAAPGAGTSPAYTPAGENPGGAGAPAGDGQHQG